MAVVNDYVIIQPDISHVSPMTVPVATDRLHSDPVAASAYVVQSLEREMDGLTENQDRVKRWVDAGAKGSFTAIFEE